MSEATERRGAERRATDRGGSVSFGQEVLACRIVDLSETGAQVRIDGKRASRNLVGKRASLTLEGPKPRVLAGRVAWARPAVNGVYLGLAIDEGDAKPLQGAPQ
ncbi:MAG: PilZ domain-containing protein [Deltaproteobacteria bacterium]|nr:PilZ domain-containing protein [Deltaproteobacteria bacterium]